MINYIIDYFVTIISVSSLMIVPFSFTTVLMTIMVKLSSVVVDHVST